MKSILFKNHDIVLLAVSINYQQIRPHLKTGDIVLFSSKSIMSTCIKIATKNKWSHVGMIVHFNDYDFITLWESIPVESRMNLESDNYKKGVQIVPLKIRIQQSEGDVAIRHLKDVLLNENDLKNLMKFRHKIASKEYEKNKIELIKSAYDGFMGQNTEDLSSIFCSELVAECYQQLGLLPETMPSNEFTPADFSDNSDLKLVRGYLSEEIIIKNHLEKRELTS